MPSVTPASDGGQQYFKAVNEIEDERRLERQRALESDEKKSASLEAKQQAALRKMEESSEKALQNARDEASQAVIRERENNRSELENLKAKTYDRFGRYNGEEAPVLKEQLRSVQDDAEAEQKRHRELMSKSEDAHDRKIEDLSKQHQDDLEARAASEHKRLTEDSRTEREHAERSIAMNREEMNQRVAETENYASKKIREHEDQSSAKSVLESDTLRLAHRNESDRLRSDIRDLLENDRNYAKEKGQGRKEAVRDYEDEWRTREKTVAADFERVNDNLKHQADEQDRYLTRLNTATLRERDIQTARQMSQERNGHYLERKDLLNGFDQERAQRDLLDHLEHAENKRVLDSKLADADEQMDKALKYQASTYQGTMESQSKNFEDQVARLQKDRDRLAYSSDPGVYSPAAEAALRRDVVKEYEKLANAQQNRHDAGMNSLQEKRRQELREMASDNESRNFQVQQQATLGEHRLRTDATRTVQELTDAKEAESREKDSNFQRSSEQMLRNYAGNLDQQRKQYEDILNAQRTESMTRMQTVQQDHEFASRMMQREFSAKQNQTVREYEKRLADQKVDYEGQLTDVKAQADQAIRENERRYRQTLDEQQRILDQRLAQMEFQQKERERYISQSYEDTVDKLKQSNAQLAKRTRSS